MTYSLEKKTKILKHAVFTLKMAVDLYTGHIVFIIYYSCNLILFCTVFLFFSGFALLLQSSSSNNGIVVYSEL